VTFALGTEVVLGQAVQLAVNLVTEAASGVR
jgi:hypothetical protein